MAWDFSTEPEFQSKLDWMAEFVRTEVEPLDLVFADRAYQRLDGKLREVVDPLKQRVREQGLWACHLGPELGGQGFGQLKLALMNEILGRSAWGPLIFGCQAPDTGNAEIIAMYGTPAQRETYLRPLLEGEIFSAYSMTEPHAGSDPTLFTTRAVRDGDDYVITGEKYFTSNARNASFLIVMAVTDPEAHPYQRMSMFLVPTDTPGVRILRNVATMGERSGRGGHAHIRYEGVRVPAGNLLGEEGGAFAVAQARLGGGRIHHAMRTVGQCNRAFDMLCERALSRATRHGTLADYQLVQSHIAECYVQITQFRLLVLHTAWLIDQSSTREARTQIAACKVVAPQVYMDVVHRAMHVHGALGMSNEMPFGRMWMAAPIMGIVDGPTEVHKLSIARRVLRRYSPASGRWPSEFLPDKVAAARERFAEILEHEVADL